MNSAATGAFSGIYLFFVLFLVVLAILWFFLPFAIFGTKAKLDSLIHEMKLMNIELRKGREQLSAKPQRGQSESSEAQAPSKPELTRDSIMMAKQKIRQYGQLYVFEDQGFDSLEDALAYAISKTPG